MWPRWKRLVATVLFAAVFSVVVGVVMHRYIVGNGLYDNVPEDDNTSRNNLIVNTLVFFGTLISTSRTSILFLVDCFLQDKVTPFEVGLINVFVKTTCLALFDFRIIHVTSSSNAVRMGILFADIAGFMFEEGHRAYTH